ncbi:MAG TPA: hypothetical protein VGV61_12480, partial [Thermoanaerobaculia bacterium]|nr:hypothetical protein [Thermoanaerobaculia bacterium]
MGSAAHRPSPSRAATALLALAITWLVFWSVALALRKGYAIDELDYAHAAWSVAQGDLPYRDFFDHHFPLLYQALALAFMGSDDPGRLRLLR